MSTLFLVLVFLGAVSFGQQPTLFARHISQEKFRSIERILGLPRIGVDRQRAEHQYHQLVHPQIVADMRKIYDPANEERLQITYAAFTGDGQVGEDGGFGLHVVKRLVLSLENGLSRTIDVNEHWAADQQTGALFLPDEIRVKTQVKHGPRRIDGSHSLYLFDSLRLAWGPDGELTLHRRSRYGRYDAHLRRNRSNVMRVPVSSPYSCLSCHDNGDGLREHFLTPEDSINYETIVQDSHFRLPVQKMPGFRDYLGYVISRQPPRPTMFSDFISMPHVSAYHESIRQELLHPKQATRVPNFFETLERERRSLSWISDDEPPPGTFYPHDGQGVYRRKGQWLVDATDMVFEGKYRWWQPAVAVPKGGGGYR